MEFILSYTSYSNNNYNQKQNNNNNNISSIIKECSVIKKIIKKSTY